MVLDKNQKCTKCGEPDEFSDETICHKCISKWRDALVVKERRKIFERLKIEFESSLTMGGGKTDHILISFNDFEKDFVNSELSTVEEKL